MSVDSVRRLLTSGEITACAKQAETRHHPPTHDFAKSQLRHHFPSLDNTRKTANEGFRSWCRFVASAELSTNVGFLALAV